VARSEQMAESARFLARNPFALACRRCRFSVQALCNLKRYERAILAYAEEETRIQMRGLFTQKPAHDLDSSIPQARNAAPAHTRIGIFDGRNDTAHSRLD
jgi:hypothetical protein